MMNYSYMTGSNGDGVALFSWLTYVLVIALLGLGIAALWKYINQK